MASRYVTITSLEALKKLGPTGAVEWSVSSFSEAASPTWWESSLYDSTCAMYIENGYFRYLVEEDEESA